MDVHIQSSQANHPHSLVHSEGVAAKAIVRDREWKTSLLTTSEGMSQFDNRHEGDRQRPGKLRFRRKLRITMESVVVILFFTSPVSFHTYRCSPHEVRRTVLPAGKAVVFKNQTGNVVSDELLRKVPCLESVLNYLVRFPSQDTLVLPNENEFHVRSYLAADDPLEVLAALANETPFFFEYRANHCESRCDRINSLNMV